MILPIVLLYCPIFYSFEQENKSISIFLQQQYTYVYKTVNFSILTMYVSYCAFQRSRADGEGIVRTGRWCRVPAATWSVRESRTETWRPANAFAVRRCPGARVSRSPTCTWRGTSAGSIWRRKLLTVGRIHSICERTVIYRGTTRCDPHVPLRQHDNARQSALMAKLISRSIRQMARVTPVYR